MKKHRLLVGDNNKNVAYIVDRSSAYTKKFTPIYNRKPRVP